MLTLFTLTGPGRLAPPPDEWRLCPVCGWQMERTLYIVMVCWHCADWDAEPEPREEPIRPGVLWHRDWPE